MKLKVFISGGTKGIGLSIARRFYQESCDIIICARGKAGLEAAKREMPGIRTFSCDLAEKSQVKSLIQYINEEFDRLDVLVNNGGVFLPGGVHNGSEESYEKMMRTNVDSVFYITRGLLELVKGAEKGTIFNLCSIASMKAYPNGGLYGISKFALWGLGKNLREELKPFGIRVINLLPGAVKTPAWEGVSVPEERFIPSEDLGSLVWDIYKLSARTVIEDLVIRPLPGDV